jgi:putative transposase
MADLFLLSQAQMHRIERYFPLSHGIARVDDRRIVSAIVFVIKNGLRWRDAPRDYGPHKTIYIGSFAGAAWACSTRFS